MDVNREQAMRLWVNQFGKKTKVTDFAEREIVKSAYNDRNSQFGWNVDHILPQSQGGKTIDSNLICCHILTNDEKADKFPCFVANGIKFEIVKVQNHYEIRRVTEVSKEKEKEVTTNFLDSADGLRFLKECTKKSQKQTFVGIVNIELTQVKSNSIFDFISEIFNDSSLTVKKSSYSNNYEITIKNYDLPLKEDTGNILDKTILLNTYLSGYYLPKNQISNYNIYFGVYSFNNRNEAFTFNVSNSLGYNQKRMVINELAKINTEANEKLKGISPIRISYDDKFYEYNYIYAKLQENLRKVKE